MASDLTAAGDQMQSAASRVLAWVMEVGTGNAPYEVAVACLELDTAVNDWTAARSATDSTGGSDADHNA